MVSGSEDCAAIDYTNFTGMRSTLSDTCILAFALSAALLSQTLAHTAQTLQILAFELFALALALELSALELALESYALALALELSALSLAFELVAPAPALKLCALVPALELSALALEFVFRRCFHRS